MGFRFLLSIMRRLHMYSSSAFLLPATRLTLYFSYSLRNEIHNYLKLPLSQDRVPVTSGDALTNVLPFMTCSPFSYLCFGCMKLLSFRLYREELVYLSCWLLVVLLLVLSFR